MSGSLQKIIVYFFLFLSPFFLLSLSSCFCLFEQEMADMHKFGWVIGRFLFIHTLFCWLLFCKEFDKEPNTYLGRIHENEQWSDLNELS